jgi:hypothetical protein
MSNSTTNLDTIASNQASKEVVVNALLDAASPATLWGRHASACSGLTWGYYGGSFVDSTATLHAIANGTVTLTASTTNYLYADPTTGALSANTTGFPAGKIPLYAIVVGTSTVTSYTDWRSYQPSAVTPGGGGGTVTSVGLSAPAQFSVSGSPVTGSGNLTLTWANQNANYVFAGPASGAAAAPTFRALAYADLPAGVLGKPRVQSVTYASTVTLDCSLYDTFEITLTGNITINFSNGTDGQRVQVVAVQDGTGSRVITWGTGVAFGSDISSATASTGANKTDYFGLQYNGAATKYHMIAVARGY